MRRKLAAAVLVAGAAATLLPVSSANAYCDAALYAVTGRCTNACAIAGSAYDTADRATKDRLPDDVFICLA